VVENGPAIPAATIGNEQRHLNRPYASPDVARNVEFFEPIKATGGIAVADVDAGAVLPCPLKHSDDGGGRFGVVTGSVDDVVLRHWRSFLLGTPCSGTV